MAHGASVSSFGKASDSHLPMKIGYFQQPVS